MSTRYTLNMSIVTPINEIIQREIVALVDDYIDSANHLFGKKFSPIEVTFDLKGRAAGMYKVYRQQRVIRFNPYHFAKFPDENMGETIPHEVAHYITDIVYGIRNIRPHGNEWKSLMLEFGVEPKRTFSYSLEGIPTRTHKRHIYTCGCKEFEITTRRHNKIQKEKAEYSCRECGGKLKFSVEAA